MNHFFLTVIATLCMSLPTFAQKQPRTLPKKTVSTSEAQEIPSVTTVAKEPSASVAEPPDVLSTEPELNVPKPELKERPQSYPLQQVRATWEPAFLSGKWNYQGTELSTDATTAKGFGLLYRYMPSAHLTAELVYKWYSFKLDSTTANGLNVQDSTENLDRVLARLEYNWIGAQKNFYKYGVGLEAGQDSYPTLDFMDPTNLKFSKAKDTVIGLTAHAQLLFLQPFSYKFKAGYDFGTRSRNYGALKAQDNHSYFAEIGVDYMLNERNYVDTSINYRVQKLTVSRLLGSDWIEWDTRSNQTNLQLSYTYTY